MLYFSVIFESPAGMTSDVWALIWPHVAKNARVSLQNFKDMINWQVSHNVGILNLGLCYLLNSKISFQQLRTDQVFYKSLIFSLLL